MSVRLGLELPLPAAQSSVDAVRLALDDAGIGPEPSAWQLTLVVKNDTLPATGFADPQQGAENVTDFVRDPTLVAVIGPFNSTVARAEIPITNGAGLLQCGFATTAPDLTKPPEALQVRAAVPQRINFVRVAAPDDLQGPAAARFALTSLHLKRAFVIDDGLAFGEAVADAFSAAYAAAGGEVVGRASLPNAAAAVVKAKARQPDVVYFGGASVSGAGTVRSAMARLGLGRTPFLGSDGIVDATFLADAGAAATGSYGTVDVAPRAPGGSQFAARYRAAYGADPGPYDIGAYACAEIVLDALRDVGAVAVDELREAVRADVVHPAHGLPTVLGPLTFDANGDTTTPVISIYKVDPAAIGGAAWVFADQVLLGQP